MLKKTSSWTFHQFTNTKHILASQSQPDGRNIKNQTKCTLVMLCAAALAGGAGAGAAPPPPASCPAAGSSGVVPLPPSLVGIVTFMLFLLIFFVDGACMTTNCRSELVVEQLGSPRPFI
jgi:hypothetical protein